MSKERCIRQNMADNVLKVREEKEEEEKGH